MRAGWHNRSVNYLKGVGSGIIGTAQGGGGLGADEPAYAGLNLVFAGDSTEAKLVAGLTATGATPLGAPLRFGPEPAPNDDTSQNPVDPALCAIITGKDGLGLAVQCLYPNSSGQQGGHWAVVGTNNPNLAGTKTHYIQAYLKFGGSVSSSTAVKFHRMILSGVPGGGEPQWNTIANNDPFNSGASKHTFFQYIDNGFTDEVGAYPAGHDQGTQPFGPYFQDLFDSLWHRFTWAFKCHTASNNKDGFARLWIDGTKIMDVCQATVGVSPAGGEKQWTSQPTVDCIHVNTQVGSGSRYTDFGGTMTSLNRPAWSMAINVGDGNPTTLSTFKWWTD